MYHTLHEQLLVLPADLPVYPTHGAGSFCSAPASSDRVTTIGLERANNRLAQARGEAEFVSLALGGLPELTPLTPVAVREYQEQGGAVLDVRPAQAFASEHIPCAYGIAVEAPLITWAGWLIPFGTPLVLVSDGRAERQAAVRQLIRIGYDDLRGYLEGGLAAWRQAGLLLERIQLIDVGALRRQLGQGKAPIVLDVRQDAEWVGGHFPGAVHIENGRLPYDDLPLPLEGPIAIHCQH